MSVGVQTQVNAPAWPLPSLAPARPGLLQRARAPGTAGTAATCPERRNARPSLQRPAAGPPAPAAAPPGVHDVLRSPGQPLDTTARAFFEPRFGHDFGRVRVHPAPLLRDGPGGRAVRSAAWQASLPDAAGLGALVQQRLGIGGDRIGGPLQSGESSCSPTWFGETVPETDASGGSFTGRVTVKYNDAALKDPCVRECVEVHEGEHVRQLTPVVKKIRDCDVAAGNDWNKKEKCNEIANRELNEPRTRWECEAYRKSFTCLTLKVLDSASPCSKAPHREAIQKHRGYEACEMKRYCHEAGTPEAGFPNV